MTKLRQSPYNLQLGQVVVATVQGVNIIGDSLASDENIGNAVIRTEPLAPLTMVERVNSGTTDV